MNVLLTDISSYKSIVLAKYIKSNFQEVRVIACDTREISKTIHSRYPDKYIFVKNKIETGQMYFDSLKQIIEQEKIDICIPINNKEMKVLMKFRKELPDSLSYLGTEEEYKQLDNKDILHEIVKSIGIKVPENYPTLDETKLPFVYKPVNLSSASGIKYIKTEKEKSKIHLVKENYMLQEYIRGFGAGYSVFCRNGEILTGYAHRRICEYPISGGSSVYREDFYEERLHEISAKILERIRWSGFVMFEFKITEDNDIYFIEANPRIWGSVNQGLQNGVNYLEHLLNRKIVSRKAGNKRTYFSPLVYLALFHYTFKGKLSYPYYFFRKAATNKSDVSLFDDFFGWLSFVNIIYEKN